MSDAVEGLCVPLLASAKLSSARYPPAGAVYTADAGEGTCVPLLPTALLCSFAAVCLTEAVERIGALRLPSA